MFINVVQKAQPLFKDFPEVSSKEDAKQQALANPIFSWHVKYVNYKRKKVVIFTNDATTLTIVLYDINAKNRAEMEEKFKEQLAIVWQEMDMTKISFEAYCQAAGKWQVGPTISRSQIGRLTDMGLILGLYLDDGMIDQSFVSLKLSQSVRTLGKDNYTGPWDIPDIMQPDNLKWHESKTLVKETIDVSYLQQICDELKQIRDHSEEYIFTTDLDKVDKQVKKISKLNSELIDSFINDVKDDYSEKMVKSYHKALSLYLNEFLSYRFITLFDIEASSVGELYLHGSSMTEVKRVQRSMSKFYKFLADNKLIDADFTKAMKREMKNNIEAVEFNMWE